MAAARHRDVDEGILQKANAFLPYLRRYARHYLVTDRISQLHEIPELFVLLFELVAGETIPDEQKPFEEYKDKVDTLQRILDTLDDTLHLPLSHVTGRGLVLLDRRHLFDALEIFMDIVTHCFPETPTTGQGQADMMTLSQLEVPRFQDVQSRLQSSPMMRDRSTQTREGPARVRKVSALHKRQRLTSVGTGPRVSTKTFKKLPSASSSTSGKRPGTSHNQGGRLPPTTAVQKGSTVAGSRRHVGPEVRTSSPKPTARPADPQIHAHAPGRPRSRRPSVLSTKIRRLSTRPASQLSPIHVPSPRRQPDTASPRTTTLCSSIALLKEAEYLQSRWTEIDKQLTMHRESIRSLEQEKARLKRVLLHVQQQFNRAVQQVAGD